MRVRRAIALLSAATLLAACSSASSSPSAEAGGIDATLAEWSITLSSNTASAGEVTFNIANEGEKTHEFVVVRTDLAEDALPVVEDEIPEDSSELTAIDEVEDIEAGATDGTLTVTLEAGHYVIFCNLTAHYGKGMHATLTVS